MAAGPLLSAGLDQLGGRRVPYLFTALAAMGLVGAAYGLLNAALGRQAVASMPAGRTAMGSGASKTARYLGSAMGLALVTVLVTHAGRGARAAELLAGWEVAVLMTAAFSLLGALVVFLARERRMPARSRLRREPSGATTVWHESRT